MAFFDPESGELLFACGLRLHAGMKRADVLSALRRCAQPPADLAFTAEDSFVPFPAFRVPGGQAAPICVLRHGVLRAVELNVAAVGQREHPPAELARAMLFGLARCKDPAPDSRAPVLLSCAFGTLLVSTDPRTGASTLRVTYKVPDKASDKTPDEASGPDRRQPA